MQVKLRSVRFFDSALVCGKQTGAIDVLRPEFKGFEVWLLGDWVLVTKGAEQTLVPVTFCGPMVPAEGHELPAPGEVETGIEPAPIRRGPGRPPKVKVEQP